MNKTKQIHLPITKEEQAQRLSIYLAQKKEQLFQGCYFALISNPEWKHTGPELLAETAEDYAEVALKKLYPNLKSEE